MAKTGQAKFDTFAEEFDFWNKTLDSYGYQDEMHQEVLRYLPSNAARVLDAGCGTGLFALNLAGKVNHVVGMDISRSMITLARRYRKEQQKRNVDFMAGEFDGLPFKSATFDFVVSLSAFHEATLDSALPGICKLLKPNGKMVLSIIITPHPVLDTMPVWKLFVAFKKAPRYAFSFGFKTMWRLLSFEANPVWIRYECNNVRDGKIRTAESLITAYQRLLPGCKFIKHHWRVVVIWQAPPKKR